MSSFFLTHSGRIQMFLFSIHSETAAPSTLVRIFIWAVALTVVMALGFLRVETDAEYAFASAVIGPIVLVTWLMGRSGGLILTAIAMVVWIIADWNTDRQFGAWWIPIANGIMRFVTYSFVAVVVSRLHELLIHEREQSTCDPLTGLLNRRAFLGMGDFEVERARRYGHPLAVVFLDLDNFKQINDTRGHAIGDSLLQTVAAALRNSLRTTDSVARIGGDEFAIMLPEIGHAEATETGQKIAENIRAMIAEFPPVSASIGVAWFAVADRGFQDMVKSADGLMYEIKKSGKNNVRIHQMGPASACGVG